MQHAQPFRVLVILPNNLGDVIMATPVLEGLKARHPGCRIAFLVEEGFEGGLENSPHVDELVRMPRRAVREALLGPRWRDGISGLRDLVARVRESRYDICLNLSQHAYIAHLVTLFGVSGTAGKTYLREGNESVADLWSQYLYAIPFARRCNRLHATDVYRRIAGVVDHRGGYTLLIGDDERRGAAQGLRSRGIDVGAAKIAVFQPGAAFPAKKWPVEHFIALGRMLVEEGWQIVVSGAPSEVDECRVIQEALGSGCVATAGTTTFRQAAAQLAHARLCVTGDTALMHAAAALDVHTVALFGPTSPVETGPYGDGHTVISAGCPNRPCFETHCRTRLCMKSILPETVHGLVRDPGNARAAECNAWVTRLKPDGDYRIEALSTGGDLYASEAASCMTLRAFGDEGDAAIDGEDLAECRRESAQALAIIEAMAQDLRQFTATRDPQAVRAFERRKSGFDALRGIGQFWGAMLNLGLNSVPLIDPAAGVRASMAVCEEAARRIRRALI